MNTRPGLGILNRRKLRARGHDFIRPLALAYRTLLLSRVTFIGVTGSTGKTTTKELVAAALSSHLRGSKSRRNRNISIHWEILRIRPWRNFHVQEIAAAGNEGKIALERPLRVVRPRIGVVTNIGADHLKAFGSVDAIAAEKSKLIAALPRSGTAILNADDARVLAMKARCRCRVITFGTSRHATLRAENVRSAWPERLCFDVLHAGERLPVRTKLCGTLWLDSVLAALCTALAMGLPLTDAIRAIEAVEPVKGRMQPVIRPDGVTFIRDDTKAPLWTIAATLKFLRDANASRKVIVVGTISDYIGGSSTARYSDVARQSLDVADLVVFAGPKSPKCERAKNHPKGDALLMFLSVEGARDYLGTVLRRGDLVLLKGTYRQDRLDRLCSVELETRPSMESEAARAPDTTRSAPMQDEAKERRREKPAFVVIGLGNPGEAYRNTPHNVGHRVLDRLADSSGGEWEQRPEALASTVEWRGTRLHLVKPTAAVNRSGPVLLGFCQETGLRPADCILVQDDMDLPLGTTRMRQRGGSDGGHKGVRSLLQALGTHRLARVKIGVGRPTAETDASSHVLRPFSPEELTVVDAACAKAADNVLELVHRLRTEASKVTGVSSQETTSAQKLIAAESR